MEVGYGHKISIKKEIRDKESKRALIIRKSWGEAWGEKGYRYLAYNFVLEGLAEDWWTLIYQGWVDTGQFAE